MIKFAAPLLCAALLGSTAGTAGAGMQEEIIPMTTAGSPLEKVEIQQNLNGQLPLDAVFKDDAGRDVKFGDYLGGKKPVLLVFAYYECPMLCTLVLNGIVRVLNGVTLTPGKDFDVVAVSFNPLDTPELAAKKKANYLKTYHNAGTEAGWHFLTGAEDQVRRMTDAAGFKYVYDPESKEYAHASAIYVVTPAGKLSHYFFGIEYAARDLKLALVEASQGKIGTLADRILLFCFHYDPVTGKYSVMILRMVKIAGALTLLAMAGGIILMLRREQKA